MDVRPQTNDREGHRVEDASFGGPRSPLQINVILRSPGGEESAFLGAGVLQSVTQQRHVLRLGDDARGVFRQKKSILDQFSCSAAHLEHVISFIFVPFLDR